MCGINEHEACPLNCMMIFQRVGSFLCVLQPASVRCSDIEALVRAWDVIDARRVRAPRLPANFRVRPEAEIAATRKRSCAVLASRHWRDSLGNDDDRHEEREPRQHRENFNRPINGFKNQHGGYRSGSKRTALARRHPHFRAVVIRRRQRATRTNGSAGKWGGPPTVPTQFLIFSVTPWAASVSRAPFCVPCKRSTTPFSFFMIVSVGPPAIAMPASPAT